jgi:hypothetical protein
MKSLGEIGKYWRSEYSDRRFQRVRPLLLLSRLSALMPTFQKDVLAPLNYPPASTVFWVHFVGRDVRDSCSPKISIMRWVAPPAD